MLKRFARVVQVRDLHTEIHQHPAARDHLIMKTLDVVPSDGLAQRMNALPAAEIVDMLIEGTEEESGPISVLVWRVCVFAATGVRVKSA